MSKLTNEELKSLCNYSNEKELYVSKEKEDYINAISAFVSPKNKNDKPFLIEDIIKEPLLKEFQFEGLKDFSYVGDMVVKPLMITSDNKRINERFIFQAVNEDTNNFVKTTLGIVYILACEINGNEYIIKIGKTQSTFNDRIYSYNCGTINNRISGSCSTTNFKILQSCHTSRLNLKVYLCDCSKNLYSINWYGVQSVAVATPEATVKEDILIKEFIKQFGKKPLCNIQANVKH